MMLPQDVKTTVLLADGTRTILDLEKSFFCREQYIIHMATGAQEVFDLAVAHQPDILFMGAELCDMCGAEMCLRLKAHPNLCHLPVVLVVQPNMPHELLRCQRAGCDDILQRPPRRHQFLQAIEKHLQVPRRAAPRVQVHMHVKYREPSGEHDLTHYSVNVSTGGLYIETRSPLPVDTPLQLEFTIPGHVNPICCQGRVAWVNAFDDSRTKRLPEGMGVQFLGLTLEDMAVIRAFIMRSLVVPDW